MRSIGFPEILVIGFVPIAVYGVLIYCVWKFYRLLSRINDNIAGIREAIARNGPSGPDLSV